VSELHYVRKKSCVSFTAYTFFVNQAKQLKNHMVNVMVKTGSDLC